MTALQIDANTVGMANPPKDSPKRPHGPRGVAAPIRAGKYTALVQSRVTPKLRMRIQQAADAEQISVGSYVRRLLLNHVPGGA